MDLPVIFPEIENRRDLWIAIRRALNGLGLSKDIIVMTSEEFAVKRDIPGTIAYPADKEGRTLYEAA